MIAYVLNKNINGEIILKNIQKLIQSKSTPNGSQLVLVIDIKEITQDSDCHIPKLEYKQLDP